MANSYGSGSGKSKAKSQTSQVFTFEDLDVSDDEEYKSGRCCTGQRVILAGVALVVVVAIVVGVVLGLYVSRVGKNKGGPHLDHPPMGWRSEGSFFCEQLTAIHVQETVNAITESAITDEGYIYIIMDDCWQGDRNGSGHLHPDTSRFPIGYKGMRERTDKLHALGLKFGLTTSAGTLTCLRRQGSMDHVSLDASTFAYWQIDYLRVEDCYIQPVVSPTIAYTDLHNAIQENSGSVPIINTVKRSVEVTEAAGLGQVYEFGEYVYDFDDMVYVVDRVVETGLAKEGRSGFWLDLGTLCIGNGAMTFSESAAQFIMWCVFKSALFVTADVSKLTEQQKNLLTNKDLLTINQDVGVSPGNLLQSSFTSNSITQKQTFSFTCDEYDRNQQWEYLTSTKQLKHKASGFCLQKGTEAETWDRYTVVETCDADLSSQKWIRDETGGAIRLQSDPDWCLTTSTKTAVPAQVRSCELRQTIRDWQGTNEWWNNFNDAFTFNAVPGQTYTFTIKNARDLCLGVGGGEDFHTYSGLYNDGRAYLALLNRGITAHTYAIDLPDIPGLAENTNYKLKNIVNNHDLGWLTSEKTYVLSVPAHSAEIFRLTPSQFV